MALSRGRCVFPGPPDVSEEDSRRLLNFGVWKRAVILGPIKPPLHVRRPPAMNRFAWLVSFLLTATSAMAQRLYEQPPIDYHRADSTDPVATLIEQIERGEVEFEADDRLGYLPSLLNHLEISPTSQTWVYSKTSLQRQRINPRRPRAIYFNDDVYVGFVPRSPVVEIAATDPVLGAVFYTMQQPVRRRDGHEFPSVTIKRDTGQCLSCHANHRTQDVPGYFLRSVYPDRRGEPKFNLGSDTMLETLPWEKRFGGWYVDGFDFISHRGNRTYGDDGEPEWIDSEEKVFADYPHASSDIVALWVLQHQTQTHNAIALANQETRRAVTQSLQMNEFLGRPADHLSETARRRIDRVVENLLDHVTMAQALPLPRPVASRGEFQRGFETTGGPNRQLRRLDLRHRLFHHSVSHLVTSEAMMGLPKETAERFWPRLAERLESSERGREALDLIRQSAPPPVAALIGAGGS